MRIESKTATSLLALAAACAGTVGAPPAGAAGPGGASAAPAAASVTPPRGRVRPSGVATWFGPGFYGRKTACGQTLTPGVVGVANRTLPCGTLIKVSYAGRALTLPVLDRGPYTHSADWDLTAGAAAALGITETVRIGTRVVGRAANTPTLGMPVGVPSSALAGGAVAG